MDPEPTANPHAELVMECFEGPPPTESPAPDWSPITPPDSMLARGSGWCGGEEPAVEKGDGAFQETKVVDVLIDEGSGEDHTLPNSRILLPHSVGRDGDPVGLGEQIVVVEDRVKCGLVGGCTLPSLKELGLDIFVRKQN